MVDAPRLPGARRVDPGTLLDVPGYGGSGEPTRYLDVRGYDEAVAHWLVETGTERALLVGHSGGNQVAAWVQPLHDLADRARSRT